MQLLAIVSSEKSRSTPKMSLDVAAKERPFTGTYGLHSFLYSGLKLILKKIRVEYHVRHFAADGFIISFEERGSYM
jgi:hypothetical protein